MLEKQVIDSHFMRKCCRLLLGLVLAATLPLPSSSANAAPAYPDRPVRIVVGFLPGSSNDMLARYTGGKLAERMNRQFIVENRPGANGIIAGELTARATPDGHTLLLVSTSHTMNAGVYKLPFDPVKSFTPVAMLGTGPLVLVVNASSPATSVKALVDLAAAKPNTITYASAGSGGINHFGGAMFSRMTGTQLVHVPYKGGAPALTDVIGGQVQIMFGSMPLTLPQIRAGRVKALGITGARRSPVLPNVPTVAEAGVPGYEITTWWGLIAPAGVPGPIVTRLNGEIDAILRQPESAQRLESEGAEPWPQSSEAMARVIATEIEKWRRVARDASVRVE
jgi:tripartite-type tricarboxylate transporter receptor subunit TctC